MITTTKSGWKKGDVVTCAACGWSWTTRKDKPVACPECKSRRWWARSGDEGKRLVQGQTEGRRFVDPETGE